MAGTDLALSWKDHHNVLISVFERLLEKESLVDCTLAAEGKFLKAHKIVLSACSPYLEILLNQENDKHPILFLRDVEFEDLKTIVDFVYCGETKIPEDRLVGFLNLAEALQIKGLGGAESKIIEKKQHDEAPQERETASPAPKRRLRSFSSFSNSPVKNEASSDDPMQRKRVKHRKETKLKMVNVSSIASSSHETTASDITEEFNEEIPEVKQEIIDLEPTESEVVSADSLTLVPDASETNELPEVKKEFEEVTFTEVYSEDMLSEENDATESMLQPVRDEPSTSHQYPGFSSDPLNTDGLEAQAPYIVGDTKRPPTEGFPSRQFDSGGLSDRAPHMINDPEQPRPEGPIYIVQPWPSSSMENSVYGEAECSRGIVNSDKANMGSLSASADDCPQLSQCVFRPRITKNARDSRKLLSHSGERRFQCSFCSAKFRKSHNLKEHLRIHTGERPYQCSYCAAKFTMKGNLNNHLRIHTGERPFQCTICTATFTQSGHLKSHLLSHSRKRIQCSFCSATFVHTSDLRKHLRIHTGDRPYNSSKNID